MAYYVDLPNVSGQCENVYVSKTKEEAVEWIRANVGYCDDDGNIGLISKIEEEEEVENAEGE